MNSTHVRQNWVSFVFYHGGRAGIESEAAHPYAMPRHYEATFKNHPNLQCVIGHGGARDGDSDARACTKV